MQTRTRELAVVERDVDQRRAPQTRRGQPDPSELAAHEAGVREVGAFQIGVVEHGVEVLATVLAVPSGSGRRAARVAAGSAWVGRLRAAIRRSWIDRREQLDLDGDVERQLGESDRGAGVPAGIAEHLDEEVGAAVDHLGGAVEARVRR